MLTLRRNYKIILLASISSVLCFASIILYLNYLQIQNLHGTGEVSVIFNDVDQLYSESEYIVEVEVIETQSFYVNESPFTLSKAKVNKVFKGGLEENIINILENGGLIEKRNYIFEKNPVFNVGEQAIVYLHKYYGPAAEDAYFIRGAYQGKFKFADNNSWLTNNESIEEQLLIPPNDVSEGLSNVKSLRDLKLTQ
ncbi:hypothetical protein [Paenibacillus sp. GXUN7292]|uniref:hypothetical protein n=1 Tax=Paenibacillus sp. GXUN7292 TaxID=3422499 RepID=UPI003D7CF037